MPSPIPGARWRLDPWRAAVLALLLAGLAVRLAAAFPVHKYPADADALIGGICALKVLRGETPVFYTGYRTGSLECHFGAALFALFGASRASLAAVPVLVGSALLVVAYGFLSTLFGRRLACLALLFLAIPSPAFLFWTYMPITYATTLLLSALALALAVRLERGEPRAAGIFALGLTAGLSVWQSFLTFACLAPALLWLLARRRDLLLRGRFWALTVAGLLLGASPWIAFNARYAFPSLRNNFAVHPARGVEAMVENAEYFAVHNVPELVATTDPEGGIVPAGPVERILRTPVLAIHGLAALFFLAAPFLYGRGRREDRAPIAPAAWALLAGVTVAVFAVNVLSEAGELRGLTVRYLLPLYLVVAPVLALLLAAVSRYSRAAAAVLGLAIVAFNLAGYRWPWDERRRGLESDAVADSRLVAELIERRVEIVVGSYWTVYPLSFVSADRILAIPCELNVDLEGHLKRLPETVQSWALISGPLGRRQLASWAGRAGFAGTLETAAAPYSVFLPRAGALPRDVFLERVVATCGPPPPGI